MGVYNMIKNMTANGIKVDGVGMQAHLNTDQVPIDYDAIVANLQRYDALGIEVHITEMDVKNAANDDGKESIVYQTVLRACRAVKACKSFETWGYTDKYTWVGTDEHPLPFDANFNPKQAAYAIEQEFLNKTANPF